MREREWLWQRALKASLRIKGYFFVLGQEALAISKKENYDLDSYIAFVLVTKSASLIGASTIAFQSGIERPFPRIQTKLTIRRTSGRWLDLLKPSKPSLT